MSTGVSGIIYANKTDVNYEVELSFYFEKIANEERIGSKLGGNVSKEVYNNYSDMGKDYSFIFELLDTPLDNFAEELSGPNMYNIGVTSLLDRMRKVQSLFEKILSYKQVTKIMLDINYLAGLNEKILRLNVLDFAEEVSNLYESNTVFPPVVRLIVEL